MSNVEEEVATEPSFMTDLRRMLGKPTPKVKLLASLRKVIRSTLSSMNVDKFEQTPQSMKISTKSPGFSKKILDVVKKYGSEAEITGYKGRGFVHFNTDSGTVIVRVTYEMDKVTTISVTWRN